MDKTLKSMRRLILGVLILAIGIVGLMAACRAQTINYYADLFGDPAMSARYSEFMKTADQFDRKLAGCPPKGGPETCNVNLGVYDAALWNKLCDDASAVFVKRRK